VTATAESASEIQHETPDLSDWEDPPRIVRGDAAPVLSADGVEGPLDWLLEMARARKINLARLSIAALIGQFADALAAALAAPGRRPARSLGRLDGHGGNAHRTLVVAAAAGGSGDGQGGRSGSRGAARRRLLARQRMREAEDWLARRPQLGWDVFPRGRPEASLSGRGSDLTDLLRACLVMLHVPDPQAAAYRPRPPPLWRVTDALPHIRRLLAKLPDGTPLTALLPPIAGDNAGRALRCRAAASTLVAGLELARGGALTLAQDSAWADIRISRGGDFLHDPTSEVTLAECAPPACSVCGSHRRTQRRRYGDACRFGSSCRDPAPGFVGVNSSLHPCPTGQGAASSHCISDRRPMFVFCDEGC
jgi:segregation and condensation protein A